MSKIYIHTVLALAFLILFSPFKGISQSAEWYKNNQHEIDSLRKGNFVVQVLDSNNNPIEASVSYSLKNHEFPWGTALNSSNMHSDYWYAATARKFFNHGVTENAFKWSQMQPANGPVNYDDVNHYIDWCESVGWEMRGHALLWGSKSYDDFHPLQKWVKDLPEKEMYEECKIRVQREVEYYKGKINEYDVMNEAIPGHADWLQGAIGDSINWNSFKWAREADSNAKLYINDYNVITYNKYGNYIKLIQEMLDNGAPIDGIGVQSHFGSRVDHQSVKYILDSLATLGLPIKITEFDMAVGSNNISEKNQAKYYANAMRTAFAHPSVNGFVFWGFWDDRHWVDEAGIFYKNKTPKIAADSVYNLIHTTWNTSGFQTVSSTISLEVNGFYGHYEFEIEHNGEKRIVDASLLKTNSGDTVTVVFENGKLPAPKLLQADAYDENNITLLFDTKIKADDLAKDQFKIYSSNLHGITTVWQPENDSTKLILELGKKVNYRHNLNVSYFPGTVTGINGAPLEFIGVQAVNNRVPGFISGASNENGDVVILDFSHKMSEPMADDLAAFEITFDENVEQINEIGLQTDNSKQIYIKLDNPAQFGQQIKVQYTPGTLQSADTGLLSAFTPKLVVNNVLPTSINNVIDKNNLEAYYSTVSEQVVLKNNSVLKQANLYSVYNVSGIQLYKGEIGWGETIKLNTTNLNSGLIIVRFENLNRNASFNKKILINKF